MRPAGTLALLLAAALLAACGGGDEARRSSELAALAPSGSPVYAEADLGEGGERELLAAVLEGGAKRAGEPLDFERQVEPWLGARAALVFERFEGDDLSDPIAIVEASDRAAAVRFAASRDGVAATVAGLVAIAPDKRALQAVRRAAQGRSLAAEPGFERVWAKATPGSAVDVYVDAAALAERASDEEPGALPRELVKGLESAGVAVEDGTLLVSVLPTGKRIEVDVYSDLDGVDAGPATAPELLESLPAEATAALAVSGLGETARTAFDELDAEGIPGAVPPNQLESGLAAAGIEIGRLLGSLRDGAAFALGEEEGRPRGALLVTTPGARPAEAVSTAGLLAGAAGAKGVAPLAGPVEGFAFRAPELGPGRLIVAGRGERLAIGNTVPAVLHALAGGRGRRLGDERLYRQAVAALGDTPILGYGRGAAALRIAESILPVVPAALGGAWRDLGVVRFVAVGSSAATGEPSGKLILGLGE